MHSHFTVTCIQSFHNHHDRYRSFPTIGHFAPSCNAVTSPPSTPSQSLPPMKYSPSPSCNTVHFHHHAMRHFHHLLVTPTIISDRYRSFRRLVICAIMQVRSLPPSCNTGHFHHGAVRSLPPSCGQSLTIVQYSPSTIISDRYQSLPPSSRSISVTSTIITIDIVTSAD
ncbi:hypothetical protein AVEN_75237-1 [Araneus ventricosus]|uniref:Uncharacterized protein n=1 Tax=Araneus ventricosus TaxID=182803 RepID=A0A4Y2P686_ARAVE|nr:hypothetical protein AVEN_75237-1 [Araneus ventricosus]